MTTTASRHDNLGENGKERTDGAICTVSMPLVVVHYDFQTANLCDVFMCANSAKKNSPSARREQKTLGQQSTLLIRLTFFLACLPVKKTSGPR